MANFQSHYDVLANGAKVYYSDTIPSSVGAGTTYFSGDFCINTASPAVSGQTYAWLCTTGGAGSASVWECTANGYEFVNFGPLSSSSTSCNLPVQPGSWQVVAATATATAAGGSGGNLMIESLSGNTAAGSGNNQLSAVMAIGSTYTAPNIVTGNIATAPTTMVGGTNRLGIVLAGTLTGLTNLYVTVTMKRVS